MPDWNTIMNGPADESARAIVDAAKTWGAELANRKLTTAQIRGIFSEVRRIEMRWSVQNKENPAAERALILLKPKLAYQAERAKPVRDLERILIPGIDMVQGNRDQFQRFVDFFEAVLAYHKAEGGK